MLELTHYSKSFSRHKGSKLQTLGNRGIKPAKFKTHGLKQGTKIAIVYISAFSQLLAWKEPWTYRCCCPRISKCVVYCPVDKTFLYEKNNALV